MSNGLIIGGGIALLMLLGGKKKKKSADGQGPGAGQSPGGGGGKDGGLMPDGPNGGKGSGGGSGGGKSGKGGKGGGPPENLAEDAIWVSKDCKTVAYGDETGDAFWEKKGLPVAQKFIDANYNDPYEVARMMVISMAPCAVEFPVADLDKLDPMEEEFRREMFNRNFGEVYYLIQFLHDKVAALMGKEDYIIEFDDRCDVVFVGDKWSSQVASRMMRFYLGYAMPTDENQNPPKAWYFAIKDKAYKYDWINPITAIINRMNSGCGVQFVVESEGKGYAEYLSTRPGLSALYESLSDLAGDLEFLGYDALDFDPDE